MPVNDGHCQFGISVNDGFINLAVFVIAFCVAVRAAHIGFPAGNKFINKSVMQLEQDRIAGNIDDGAVEGRVCLVKFNIVPHRFTALIKRRMNRGDVNIVGIASSTTNRSNFDVATDLIEISAGVCLAPSKCRKLSPAVSKIPPIEGLAARGRRVDSRLA